MNFKNISLFLFALNLASAHFHSLENEPNSIVFSDTHIELLSKRNPLLLNTFKTELNSIFIENEKDIESNDALEKRAVRKLKPIKSQGRSIEPRGMKVTTKKAAKKQKRNIESDSSSKLNDNHIFNENEIGLPSKKSLLLLNTFKTELNGISTEEKEIESIDILEKRAVAKKAAKAAKKQRRSEVELLSKRSPLLLNTFKTELNEISTEDEEIESIDTLEKRAVRKLKPIKSQGRSIEPRAMKAAKKA
ncbi:hypothetical protein BCR36DRAFT_582499 [Piromyces finnis]|uniref:Ribosome biogenesis protein SLX9 n=1 Tax=Piromyces finnis TaxID=1754191 RepID=A0A1Y1VC58_9FUNG|nr:hypothetical protein BCR36DRAFT_582499 [Piromyces finnis]|eukprot:ORX52554.1 hypothetical protein BCR36DRAFT_582499 [Piromyces finnis]